MKTVPKDIIEIIAKKLDTRSLLRFSIACKTTYEVCHRERVWHHRLKVDFELAPHPNLDKGVSCKQIYIMETNFTKKVLGASFIKAHNIVHWCAIQLTSVWLRCCIRRKLDLNRLDGYGWPALYDAVRSRRFENIKLLLDNGADQYRRDSCNRVIDYTQNAYDMGHPDIANLFQ